MTRFEICGIMWLSRRTHGSERKPFAPTCP
jgi:hypothetical protein